jgi:ABC-2 type transport system permease protein
MLAILKKEINYYLNNPIGYIVVVLFAVFANFLFVKDIFVIGSASLRPFFSVIPWLFMVFIPALTMRIIAEEKRTNTIELLMTLPVSETQIIIAKFFALMTLVIISLALTLGLSISLSFLTTMYLPEILVGYLGVILMGATFISLSMFFSSLTKNQVVAFLGSVMVVFFLLMISSEFLANVFPKIIQDFLAYFGPVYHFENFVRGVVDLRSFFYFLSASALFLFLTIIDLEKRS